MTNPLRASRDDDMEAICPVSGERLDVNAAAEKNVGSARRARRRSANRKFFCALSY